MNMEESFEVKRNQNLINNQVKKKQESGKKESKVNLKDPRKVGDGLKSDEAEADGHGQDGPPLKKPKRKLRKPTAEEDIIDGFAILAFKNYEELSVRISPALLICFSLLFSYSDIKSYSNDNELNFVSSAEVHHKKITMK